MEKSLKASKDYEQRALKTIKEARFFLENQFKESAVSSAYYSCFYAIHSQMARLGVNVSSHKQTGIEFRRRFIKNKKIDPKFSAIWEQLFEYRMEMDYDPVPNIDDQKAQELVGLAQELVTCLLDIGD